MGSPSLFLKTTGAVKRLPPTALAWLRVSLPGVKGQGHFPPRTNWEGLSHTHSRRLAHGAEGAFAVLESFKYFQFSKLVFKAPFYLPHKLNFKDGYLIYKAHNLSLVNSLNDMPAFGEWIY